MADGFKFASSACDPEMSSPSSSWPVSDVRSTQMLRLPRLRLAKYESPTCREMSPPGGSILMTSAPRSASIIVAYGPANMWPISRIRMPARGPEDRVFVGPVTERPGVLMYAYSRAASVFSPGVRQGVYVADEGIQWRTRRKHRCRTGIQQLLHVGLRDGAADDHRDVAGVRGPQRVDGARGQGHMGARQDRKPDKLDVLLQRDRNDVLDALANSGVDDLESGIAQRARDDLCAAVVSVQTGLRHQDASPHQNTTGCWNSPHTALSVVTNSPTEQYALAQSMRRGIRLSVPSAERDSAASVSLTATESRSALIFARRFSCRSRPSAFSS